MISNYIKLAIRVLGRNKFFTAISLFGISFTLAILMILISMIETEAGKTPPLSEKDKMVVVPTLGMKRMFYDTIYAYDTTIYNGSTIIDTSYTLQEEGSNNSNNEFGLWFLEEHLSDIPNAKEYSFFNRSRVYNSYVNNSKVELKSLYSDHRFWDVFDFQFIDGFGFSQTAVENEELVAVITDDLADKYFGRRDNIVGELIEMDSRQFKIIGVVKPAGVLLLAVDIIVPYTHDHLELQNRNEYGFGAYTAMYLGDKTSDVELIKEDIAFINSKIEVPALAQDDFDIIEFKPYGFLEAYAGLLLDLDEPKKSLSIMKWVLIALFGFLIILPTLNLINLNVGRIMERSSEIGVRKSFGASQRNILIQFIIENTIQTFLGGIIGLGLAVLGIYLINDARLMGDVVLKINYRFFSYSIIICLTFGLLSGLLPAYKMSKLHVVSALKQNKL